MSFLSGLFGGSAKREKNLAAFNAQRAAEQQQSADRQANELRQSLADSQRQAAEALAAQSALSVKAQKDAEEAAYAASLTPGDSEDGRLAAEKKQRRLLSARGAAATLVTRTGDLGAAPVASRMLLGA